jgi:V8-like Glu-specific endopeptidase
MGATRLRLLAVVAVLTTVLAGATTAPAGPIQIEEPDLNGVSWSNPIPAGTAAQWSENRSTNARPIPLLAPPGGELSEEWIEPDGPMRVSAAVPPEGEALAEISLPPSTHVSSRQAGYEYPAPYTQYQLRTSEARQFPLRTIGRLDLPGGGWCSAASVGNFAIFTAGHCVHGPEFGGWAAYGTFTPAYDETKPCPGKGCPYGVWEVSQFAAANQWINRGNPHFDLGGAVLRRLNGKSISQRVGSLGFVTNITNVQHYHSFGWPGDPPFNGKKLQSCQASSAYTYSWPYGGQPDTAMGCNMTPGCSGGPWIVEYRRGNYVNGVNSVRRALPDGTSFDHEMMSPYFGQAAWNLFQALYNATP